MYVNKNNDGQLVKNENKTKNYTVYYCQIFILTLTSRIMFS